MVFLASVVRITRARSALDEDGSVLKARCTDEHQALQHAERKVRTYRKAVLGLAGLLLLSLCGNLASAALTILVFKESRRSADAIPQQLVVLSDSKAAAGAPVSTSLPTGLSRHKLPSRCAVTIHTRESYNQVKGVTTLTGCCLVLTSSSFFPFRVNSFLQSSGEYGEL